MILPQKEVIENPSSSNDEVDTIRTFALVLPALTVLAFRAMASHHCKALHARGQATVEVGIVRRPGVSVSCWKHLP